MEIMQKKIDKRLQKQMEIYRESKKLKVNPPLRENADPRIYSDGEEERVNAILGFREGDYPKVSMDTLKTYYAFLKEHLDIPCAVTGIDDTGCFSWESYYIFGPGKEKKWEKLKKKYPSHRDQYSMLELSDGFNLEEGLLVHAERISDKKRFTLFLCDLKGVDQNAINYRLINDYACWFVNNR